MNLKNSGDSTGFEPMTSAMPVQCSNQLSYEVTQWRAGQFVGLMFSRERKYNILSHDIPFTGKHEPNKLTIYNIQHSIIANITFFHMTFVSRENMSPTN